jgi:hypothetical protein
MMVMTTNSSSNVNPAEDSRQSTVDSRQPEDRERPPVDCRL